MSVRGNAAPRGMTAQNRIRLTSPFAEDQAVRQPRLGEPQSGLAIFGPRRPRLYDEGMLKVKLLHPGARLPVVAHPGEDLGYDLFALESVLLAPRLTVRVQTGIAVEARHPSTDEPLGLLVRDRSSMAARGIATTGGVIDAGYRGEILVLMTNLGDLAVELSAGEKIAQMIPVPVLTGFVQAVESLEDSERAAKGFGSSGR
jgi:dUTP pyrophosphatase